MNPNNHDTTNSSSLSSDDLHTISALCDEFLESFFEAMLPIIQKLPNFGKEDSYHDEDK